MVRQSVKSWLVGTARGALGGALVGLAALGAISAVTFIVAASAVSGALLLSPVVFVIGGIASAFTSIGAMVVGGCAAIGACYKGVSDFVDMEETLQEKDHAINLAREVNEIKKKAPEKAVRPHHEFVPEKLPEGVAKDEMPGKWVKTENLRKAANASQQNQQTR